MEIWQALFLGIVQGLTEFLPVSSSGHLALGRQLLGLQNIDPFFDVLVHVATLVVVLFMFREPVQSLVRGTLALLRRPALMHELLDESADARTAWIVLLATLPTGLVGVLFKEHFERLAHSMLAVGIGFLLTTLLLFSFRFAQKPVVQASEIFPWWCALVLGFAQALAIMPGVSRSGTTIVIALWLGAKRSKAADLSFLIAIPAILGALVLTLKDGLDTQLSIAALGVGFIAALVSGALALKVLLRLVHSGRFEYFGYYTLAAAGLALSLGVGWL